MRSVARTVTSRSSSVTDAIEAVEFVWESHSGAASWIVGVLTLGIMIPEGTSGGEEYVLMRTSRGGGG